MNNAVSFRDYLPDDSRNFGFYLNAQIGTEQADGADNFQIFICSPAWMESTRASNDNVSKRQILIESEFDANLIEKTIHQKVEDCEGENWIEIVKKIEEFGYWEFDDYVE